MFSKMLSHMLQHVGITSNMMMVEGYKGMTKYKIQRDDKVQK
jgi:hypothetical protein